MKLRCFGGTDLPALGRVRLPDPPDMSVFTNAALHYALAWRAPKRRGPFDSLHVLFAVLGIAFTHFRSL
jgi:hypothetical protein